jgi:hypothetical protein
MEDVKCNARVVHGDREADMGGRIGVDAASECFAHRWRAIGITSRGHSKLFSSALADCKRDLGSGGVVELIGNLHGDGVFAWCQVRNCDLVAFPGRVG